jgi:hypothetical protein
MTVVTNEKDYMMSRSRVLTVLAVAVVALAACSSDTAAPAATAVAAPTSSVTVATTATTATTTPGLTVVPDAATHTFRAEVWVDNWFSMSVNGTQVGEDSVPITTERSFNAETIEFTATYPLTVAFVTKDYEETDSGLEYIGTDRQQMGDGGFIAQITDTGTGDVVLTTNDTWRGLVVQRAPLNQDCVKSPDPNTDCQFEALAEPAGWTTASFDDSQWPTATVYTAAEVGTKDGYDTIDWAPDAALIWTSDLKVDNTILWRVTLNG